ncbi:MAG: GDSL-type esterase/lipase family protein [Balneolales bacterium]
MNKIPYALILFLFTLAILPAQSQSRMADPDPLRFENELEAFAAWDHKNSHPEKAILFVGSSSIKGWDTHRAFPGRAVINRGFGGSHISDVAFYYPQAIKKYDPGLVVFYAGDNDIAANKPVEQVFGDYRSLVDRILGDNPDVRFLYISIKPSGSRWDKWNKMKAFNQQVNEYNLKNDRLFYVDLATPLLNSEDRPDNGYFLEDQLHLNDRGYRVWNEKMRAELEKLFPGE